MSTLSRARSSSGKYLFDFPSEQLIAAGRLFLVIFALAAVTLDSAPRGYADQQTILLVIYTLLAALQALLVLRRLPRPREQMLAHLTDIAAISALVMATEGPVSPFFVFYIF